MGINEDEKDNYEKVNNLFLVDPNPSGSNKIPEEELFIYISLIARSKYRGVGESMSEAEGKIRFISTEISKNGDEIKSDGTSKDSFKSYATTNYTNIGGFASQESDGLLEGFGISSINIKYGASLVPQVDISFVDLRGSSLFDVLQDESKNLTYGVFFQLPYPVFDLKLKGYIGPTVTYCLHMLSWTSKFDSQTGNFHIDAKYVGFQQAFLADMNLGNVIGTVNTKEGRANLNALHVFNQTTNEYDVTPPLDKFLIDISKIGVSFENLKSNATGYEKYVNLNTLVKKLIQIRTLIGGPMGKDKDAKDETKPFDQQPNTIDSNKIITKGITEDDLLINIDYISLRDWIIIKKAVSNYKPTGQGAPFFGQFLNTLNNLVEDYNGYLTTNEYSLIFSKDELILGKTFSNFSTPPKDANGGSLNYYPWIDDIAEAPVGEFKVLSTAISWKDVKESMQSGNLSTKLTEDIINEKFNTITELTPEFFAGVEKNFTKNSAVLVYIYDFSDMRQNIQTLIEKVNKKRELEKIKLTAELNTKLTEKLGFNPTIRYVFTVICNNVQAMLKTLYDISDKAHEKNIQLKRSSDLFNYTTDLPIINGEPQSFPWPAINSALPDGGGFESAYIGDAEKFPSIDQDNFPEIKFIREFIKKYLEKETEISAANQVMSKLANSGKDTDDWFPINPIDYRDNPFLNLVNVKDGPELEKNLSNTLALRAMVSKNYSNYKKDDLRNLGKLDALIANKTMFDKDGTKQILSRILANGTLTPSVVEGSSHLVKLSNNEFRLSETSIIGLQHKSISGIQIGGYRDNGNGSYILIGSKDREKIKEIKNNSNQLLQDVIDSDSYKQIKKIPSLFEQDPYFYKNKNINIQNLAYKVWRGNVNINLTKFQEPKNLKYYSLSDISLIDGGTNLTTPAEQSSIVEKAFINILQKTPTQNVQIEKYLTNSNLYNIQLDDKAKALLLLNTLPFDVFEKKENPDDECIKNLILDPDYNYAKIVILPKYYLYWIGSALWRYEWYETSDPNKDPIIWFNSSDDATKQETSKIFQVDYDQFIYKIGEADKFYGAIDSKIGDSLKELPPEVKDKFIKYFEDWVESTFSSFEDVVKRYVDATQVENIKETSIQLRKMLGQSEDIVLVAPNIFDTTFFNDGLKISGVELGAYVNGFLTEFKDNSEKDLEKKADEASDTKDVLKDNDMNLSIYNYFKNIYNKWVAGTPNSKKLVYNACGNDTSKNLIDYFQFINRSWSNIGDKAVINLKSLTSLSNNMDTSIYFLISKILRDNKFLFQILPNYINFKNPEDVKVMFKPQMTLDEVGSGGPTYVCIFAGGQSESLDIRSASKGNNRVYAFPNDSYSVFDKKPSQEYSEEESTDFAAVAFRVAFGAENQSIFKDVSLDQTEFRETGEYFRTLSELVDKKGKTQKVFKGTDLLKIFRTRSYKCGVDSLGCLSIQPLMYFQLDNVPFFNGTYLITDVNHSIQANHMTTNFSGLRQSSAVVPIVEKYTTFLPEKFEEINEEPLELTNLTDKDPPVTHIGVIEELAPLPFNYDIFTITNFKNLKVPDEVADKLFTIDDPNVPEPKTYFRSILEDFGITRNDQVAMFLSEVLFISNDMKNTMVTWNIDIDGIPQEKLTDKWPNNEFKYNPSKKPEIYLSKGYITTADKDKSEPWINLYRFRERGYLNLVGEEAYNDANKDPILKIWLAKIGYDALTFNIAKNPNVINDDILLAFMIAAYVFTTNTMEKSHFGEKLKKTFKDKSFDDQTSNQIAEGGSGPRHQLVTQLNTGIQSPDYEESFQKFYRVLKETQLLSYINLYI